MSALLQLQQAVAAGNIQLSTLRRDIRPADIALTAPFLQDVTATILIVATGTWHQHFTMVLNARAAAAILAISGSDGPPIV